MMIEMGKKYQTRDGRAVRILCVDGPHPTYPVIGVVNARTVPDMWTEYGQFVEAGQHIPDLDLVPVPNEAVMQWGSDEFMEPAVYVPESHRIVHLHDFLQALPKGVHEIILTWEEP